MRDWIDEQVEHFRTRQSDVVDLYALVLYRTENANMVKLLRDADYWRAFDSVSGSRLAVFSVRAASPPPLPQGDPEGFGFMVGRWREPEDNLPLMEDLALSTTQRLPMLVVFTHVDGEIARAVIPLDEETLDAAYKSLKDALTLLADAMAKISEDNIKNPEGLIAAANLAIDDREGVRRLRAAERLFKRLKGFLF